MIPVMTINGRELTQPQVRLLRKLILSYIADLSEMIWDYVEKNDTNMASLPLQRARGYELLEMIDGVALRRSYPKDPNCIDVTLQHCQLAFPHSEMTRISLTCQPAVILTPEELQDRDIMVQYVFLKT